MKAYGAIRGETKPKGIATCKAQPLRIEGAYYTQNEIAARVGVTRQTISGRLKRERIKSGPITWAALSQ